MSAAGRNPFETDLDKNPANYMPMHPSRFLERALETYPGRTAMIHGARSFTYWPIRQAVERLRDLPNIYYDTSAVTDVRPYITLLTKEDPKRIFWGSDGVGAAFFHGHYAALGRAWQHYDADDGVLKYPHCDGRPVLSVYEQLLSLRDAAEIAQLSKSDIEGIFWRNAAEALGVPEDEGFSNGAAT